MDDSLGARMQVLLVDDDPVIQRLVNVTLSDEGHDVRAAGSGQEALLMLEESLPDAIVLDLHMPEMDGRSFFHRLRERGIEVPVLILSAYGAHRARRELGAGAALDKPFEPQELLRRLERLVTADASGSASVSVS